MEFIIASPAREELSSLAAYQKLDIDIGKQNDFVLDLDRKTAASLGIEKQGYLFSPGTEFGGIFDNVDTNTGNDDTEWSGILFRGMLERDIIQPPSGQDYRVVSGEANNIIRTILAENGALGGFFTVPAKSSGTTIQSYQFDRYVTKLKGLSDMLASKNLRLWIHAEAGAPGESFTVYVEAVPVMDYSNELEYSQDSHVVIRIKDYSGGINHLICLGQGELHERQRVDLYVQADGSIGLTKYYTGIRERTDVYDYSSVESIEDLTKGGIERLTELMSSVSLDMDIAEDFDPAIGDIIGGRDYESGVYLAKPVTGKILRADGSKQSIQVSVE
jgi:hypothetical protein